MPLSLPAYLPIYLSTTIAPVHYYIRPRRKRASPARQIEIHAFEFPGVGPRASWTLDCASLPSFLQGSRRDGRVHGVDADKGGPLDGEGLNEVD
jgi:hypothetical protein